MDSYQYWARLASAVAAIACIGAAQPAAAALDADATISATQLTPTTWHYTLTLTDAGTTNVGTFWFAWIPGQDYMPTQPVNIASPASWAAVVTGGNPNNGYAIQWVAGTGAALTPGQSSSAFSFDSATTPQQMAGDSPFYPGTPMLTSFAYIGAPFADPGYQFVVQTAPVPEPSTMVLLSLGGLVMAGRIARRGSRRTG
jgi:hypothetical protein